MIIHNGHSCPFICFLFSVTLFSFSLLSPPLSLLSIQLISGDILKDTPFPTVTYLSIESITSRHPLHCSLVWSHTHSPIDPTDHYNVYWSDSSEKDVQLLGRAYVNRFSVVNLKINRRRVGEGVGGKVDVIMFIVQAVSVNGRSLSVANSTSLTLHV